MADATNSTTRRAFTRVIVLVSIIGIQRVSAQGVTTQADLLFYGDNTEFANPFREGETILGTAGRVFLAWELSDAATLRAGLFAKGRFGSHEFVEEAEPLIALELKHATSRFVFGSLDTLATRRHIRGPDEDTPHGLLPPLQRETLTFVRAHEMGLQWRVDNAALDHDVWINWQRLNTAAHRERFDAGARSRVVLPARFALHGQWHVTHEGGQQFANGPVRDSHAAAAGLEWTSAPPARSHASVPPYLPVSDVATRIVLEAHAVVTSQVPDRERPDGNQNGFGLFARAALLHRDWRGHVIVWRSRDTLKEESDANYMMLQRDGGWFRKVRDYGEAGLTRHFYPAPTVQFDASARLHRIESHYGYSYRLLARVSLRKKW